MKELDVHVVLSILTSGNAYNGKIDCNIQLILFDIFLKILNRIPHRDRLIVSAKFKFMMKRIHFFAIAHQHTKETANSRIWNVLG